MLMIVFRAVVSILVVLFLSNIIFSQSDLNNNDCYAKHSKVKNLKITTHQELVQQLDALDSIVSKCKVEDKEWINGVLDQGMSINDSLFYHSFIWNYYLYLYRAERYEDGITYANQLIKYADETGYHLSGDFYIETGLNHQYKSDFAQEINMYHQAEDAYKRDQDVNLVYALSCIGAFCLQIGNYDQVIDYHNRSYKEALGLEKDFQKYYVTSNQLLGLAKIYAEKKDYDKAIEYLDRSVVDVLKQNNEDLVITIYADYLQILMDAEKLNEALAILKKSEAYFNDGAKSKLKSEYLRYYQLRKSKLGQLTKQASLMTHPDTLLNAVHKNDGKKEIFEYGVKYFTDKKDYNNAMKFSAMEIALLKQESKTQKKSATDLILEKQKSNKLTEENYALKESERTKKTSLFLLTILLLTSLFGLMIVWRWHVKSKKYNKEIEAKNKRITAYSDELQQITYVMTHDLKEPAKTIHSFSNLVNNDFNQDLPASAKPMFDIILKTSEGMLETLSNFHSYLILGKKSKIEYTDLNDTLLKVKTNLAGKITDSDAIIQSQRLPKLNVYPEELLKLFQSLISNSIKYAKKGVAPLIEISCTTQNNNWLFSFKDNGIGVPEKSREEIFSLFNRLHTKDQIEGSGIGLANCKKIIDLHKGKIWLESKEGLGSTIFFTISNSLKD